MGRGLLQQSNRWGGYYELSAPVTFSLGFLCAGSANNNPKSWGGHR